jgi:hypothetical protein
MAKYIPQNRNPSTIRNDLTSIIESDNMKISSTFFEKYKDTFNEIKNSMNDILSTYGYNQASNLQGSAIENFKGILLQTINKNTLNREVMDIPNSGLTSGIRSITDKNMFGVNSENQIIESFQKLTSEIFSLMDEYWVAVSLIPQIKRVLNLLIRDILNADEITKRCIKHVYAPTNIKNSDINEEDIQKVNDIIDYKITEGYKIKSKLKIWLYEMLIKGAKPILVLPYKDVIRQAVTLSQNPEINYSTEDFNTLSLEELYEIANEKIDINSFKFRNKLEKDIFVDKKRKNRFKSTEEDLEQDFYNKNYDDIITDDIINEFYDAGLEQLQQTLNLEIEIAEKERRKARNSFGIESNEDVGYSETSQKTIDALTNTIKVLSDNSTKEEKDRIKNEEMKLKVKNKIKDQLQMFMANIDENVDLVKNDYNTLNLAKKEILGKGKYDKQNKNIIDGMYIRNKDQLEEMINSVDKEVLLIELEPENVIPIVNGSEHIGYYIFEKNVYQGPTQSTSKRTASFAKLLASTGYKNDSALLSTANGLSLSPDDPSVASVFSPMSFTQPGNNIDLGITDPLDGNRRIEILKQIIYKTIANKIDNPSLIDARSFQDSIMNLLRQGYILNRRVQFTFVPLVNMVYFAHDLDDKGLPHSILDGSLLDIYIYLAALISSTLGVVQNSASEEKYEINIGLNNEIGMTLNEMQKNLSTRNVYVNSFFDNIGSVLRNCAQYFRVLIPVVQGEKLYEVSSVDKQQVEIDNEFINQRLNDILSNLPCPPSITNQINELEFSRGIINQNIEYRNSIMEKQDAIMPALTKLYRLLCMYMKIKSKVGVKEKEENATTDDNLEKKNKQLIDIRDINVKLSPPMYLSAISISESFSNIEPILDNYIKYAYGEDVNDDVTKIKVLNAKKKLIMRFSPNVDLEEIIKFLNQENDDQEFGKQFVDIIKDKKINDTISKQLGDI